MLEKLSLRLRVFLFFVLIGLGCVAIIEASLFFAAARTDPADPTSGYVLAGVLSGFLCLGLVLFVWRLFDENVARAIERLAAELRARAHTDVAHGIDAAPARYLGDLAPAADAMAGTLVAQKSNVQETLAQNTADLRAQSAQLTALLSDIQAGLLLCSANHQLVFYNTPAIELLRDSGKPHLDHSVFDYLRAAPIRQTYRRLRNETDGQHHADLLVSTVGGGRSIAAHMRLVSGALGIGVEPGYVLTLRDVTADLGLHAQRDRLIHEAIEDVREPAANLTALIELERDALSVQMPELLTEADTLTSRIRDVTERFDAEEMRWWPMQEVRAAHLIDGLRGALGEDGPTVEAPAPDIKLRCDGFAIVGLLATLVEHLHNAGLADAFSVAVVRDGAGAIIRLSWRGGALSDADLRTLLSRPVPDSPLELTGREVLDHHGTDIWTVTSEPGVSALVLPINVATDAAPQPERAGLQAERPTVFDFGLLNRSSDRSMQGKRLSDLTYVVFDTETTGLEPQNGDEIVQIAAVRLLNGKRVEGEVMDQLVDPERSIPAQSTAVHGITETMVQGAPTIRVAGAQFERFCEHSVLVAHNAPFDMAFFHRHAENIGTTFDHPVFDTVLLSAILFGQDQNHTLDALAERFGVVIPEKDRHTALGDTVATADVFQKMIPMLEAKGLATFDAVLGEMTRNSKLMREMKARVGS